MTAALPRRPEEIVKDINQLNIELDASYKFYKVKPEDSLQIPNQYLRHFGGRRYYHDWIEKLAWEEED
jgi:hypothetical protein